MKRNSALFLIPSLALMIVSCGKTSDNTRTDISSGEDTPPLEYTDADRTFGVLLEISSDSLLTCNNNFSGKDANPLILDTTNPAFPDYLSEWFASMDPTQIDRLKNGSELHISVGDDVKDATIEKVKRNVRNNGIEGISVSNF